MALIFNKPLIINKKEWEAKPFIFYNKNKNINIQNDKKTIPTWNILNDGQKLERLKFPYTIYNSWGETELGYTANNSLEISSINLGNTATAIID